MTVFDMARQARRKPAEGGLVPALMALAGAYMFDIHPSFVLILSLAFDPRTGHARNENSRCHVPA